MSLFGSEHQQIFGPRAHPNFWSKREYPKFRQWMKIGCCFFFVSSLTKRIMSTLCEPILMITKDKSDSASFPVRVCVCHGTHRGQWSSEVQTIKAWLLWLGLTMHHSCNYTQSFFRTTIDLPLTMKIDLLVCASFHHLRTDGGVEGMGNSPHP